jgi:hypothetical protein
LVSCNDTMWASVPSNQRQSGLPDMARNPLTFQERNLTNIYSARCLRMTRGPVGQALSERIAGDYTPKFPQLAR